MGREYGAPPWSPGPLSGIRTDVPGGFGPDTPERARGIDHERVADQQEC
ncbi:hypothetical protein BN2537_3457 [Streptomyces venezuelae]|nr:hypothetical protein BN2537_3457 [Streptomyces venezuelae]